LFDADSPLHKINNATAGVCSARAIELAREGVAQSVTLVKNQGGTLPIDANRLTGKVAVIGPMLGDQVTSGLSSYYGPLVSCGNAPFWVGHHHTMRDAVEAYVSAQNVEVHCGTSDSALNATTGKLDCALPSAQYNATSVQAAVAVAARAEVVILVIGTGTKFAGEGHDATNISMPDAQARLVTQVAAAAAKPITVVTVTASALDIAAILQNVNVGAVLHAGEPADSSLGVADVIFGKRVPAGRMVQTVYPNTWQNSISILDMGMRPGPSQVLASTPVVYAWWG
jgi:beta-D-xylosidase 4